MSLLCSSRVVSAPETAISFVAGSFDSGTRGNGWEASRPARCVPAPPCTRSNIVPMSFRCHSGVVSYQEARPIFLRWNDPRTKISFVANSFHFRTRGNDTRSSFEGTTGTQSERPTEFGGGGPNGGEGWPNDGRAPASPVLVPVVRTSFLVRGSFRIVPEGKDVSERRPNGVGTGEAGGQKWECFPHRKASFRRRSTIVPIRLPPPRPSE